TAIAAILLSAITLVSNGLAEDLQVKIGPLKSDKWQDLPKSLLDSLGNRAILEFSCSIATKGEKIEFTTDYSAYVSNPGRRTPIQEMARSKLICQSWLGAPARDDERDLQDHAVCTACATYFMSMLARTVLVSRPILLAEPPSME